VKKSIYFPSFGTKLGFSNTAFQYLFVTHAASLFSFNLVLGKLDSGNVPAPAMFPIELFGLENYGEIIQPDCRIELSVDRLQGFQNDINNVHAFLLDPVLQTLEISGYFQYHTSLMRSSGLEKTFENVFIPKSKELATNKFQRLLYDNQQSLSHFFKDKTLIVCHIRLGDYKFYESRNIDFTYTTDIASLVDTIKDFIAFNYIRDAEIYIASDAPDECLSIFQENGLNPLTAASFFPGIDTGSGTALMLDLSAISMANVFFASNSSFSLFGSLLNKQSSLFFRPSPEDKKMIAYLPWNTQILYKKSPSYPSTL
jgi:hypothetical protein